MHPPAHVLEAFGADGPALKLPGGRGTAWRVGNVVLKPLDVLPSELEWLHEITWCDTSPDDIRLSLPIMSRTGELVVDGWTAFPVLDGEHKTERWAEIATVARGFADRFRGVDRPAFLDDRSHGWARADRLAWGEVEPADIDGAPFLTELLAARRVVSDPQGIIHGDLTGNVLFDEVKAPAVLDLTLYWRPVRYAIAIIAVDAVCFEGAPMSLLETIEPTDGFAQYLVRGLVFRIATDWFNQLDRPALNVYQDISVRVLDLVSDDDEV
ncbi:hypothetical protein ASG80_06985 [Agromyces sp. Soil535]|nr:hypothetical protein ASG80_06985 [Agromyces sp. Soil535]